VATKYLPLTDEVPVDVKLAPQARVIFAGLVALAANPDTSSEEKYLPVERQVATNAWSVDEEFIANINTQQDLPRILSFYAPTLEELGLIKILRTKAEKPVKAEQAPKEPKRPKVKVEKEKKVSTKKGQKPGDEGTAKKIVKELKEMPASDETTIEPSTSTEEDPGD